MLMAASEIRQMTRDADLSTHGVDNDVENVRAVAREISQFTPEPHDGVIFDEQVGAEIMREDAEYQGVRCNLVARLGRAKIPVALDFSFGDPDRSTSVELRSLLDRAPVRLKAYPLALNLAEKIVTAMQRREVSTRDRDFADLWVTSRLHRISAKELRAHITDVAAHRNQALMPLSAALEHMPDRQQPYEAMVERMAYLHPPPELFVDVLSGVIEFVDPLLDTTQDLTHWNPRALRWQ